MKLSLKCGKRKSLLNDFLSMGYYQIKKKKPGAEFSGAKMGGVC